MKFLKYLILSVLAVIALFSLVLFTPALWHRWVTYPRLEKAVAEIYRLRKEQAPLTDLKAFRGVMHVHSYWSHDSEGTLSDLIPAAKKNGIDFIFLTDHPHGDKDTLPRGYKGYYDGVLVEPGSEKAGFDAWPLDTVLIDWGRNSDTISKEITTAGGVIFYAHTEEPHNWGNKWYQGMEIYNFHTDTKDENVPRVVINFLVNGKKYGGWAQRELFDEQLTILHLWDSLNCQRKIVGFSAVDTHENQNIRARYLRDGRVEWVGPNANVIDTANVTMWNKWLFHEPDGNGWIFRMMLDTYITGFNYITNYLFADTLTARNLALHMKKGHLFTAFKSLGDAKGFMFCSVNTYDRPLCIMGDSIELSQVHALKAVSPLPGKFRLFHDGKIVDATISDDYQYSWNEMIEKGAYRIEVQLKLRGKYVPWIYSNPIYVY